MRGKPLAAAVAACVLTLAGSAGAQSLEDQLRAELRATLDQLHQLQDSQADLQAQKTAAEQERDALKAKLGGGRSAASPALQAELDKARADNARLTQAVQADEAEISKYKDAYTQLATSDQQIHAEHDRAVQDEAATVQSLADCETKNITLVKIARDVLSAYTKIGVKDALERGEPFIGLKRVKLEQIAQDYGDKVYEAKFDPRAVKPAAAASAAPAPPSNPPSTNSP